MNLLTLVNNPLQELAAQEIKEFLDARPTIDGNVLSTEVAEFKDVITYVEHAQAPRRILLGIPLTYLGNTFAIAPTFPWKDFLEKEFTFKIEVENVKGQENRTALAKKIATPLLEVLTREGFNTSIHFKDSQYTFIVYISGTNYYLGIDLLGKEVNLRSYRVFAHQASFKGDFGYYFVRKSQFTPSGKMLVGFMKDGVLAIEAGIYAYHHPLLESAQSPLVLFLEKQKEKNPLKKILSAHIKAKETSSVIVAIDESTRNVTAASKNVILAGLKGKVQCKKCSHEDIEVKFGTDAFTQIIFHITSKDEEKLSELYYQAKLVLKPQGYLMFITRPTWTITISENFTLVEEQVLQWGGSSYKYYLLRKK